MLKELRDLLMKIVNDIDSGNSNIDESQTIEIASAIGELVSRYNKPKIPNKLTRLEACKYLGISSKCRNDIDKVCTGYINPKTGKRYLSAHGYKWKYKEGSTTSKS